MNVWQKLKNWEITIERGPRQELVKTLVLIFTVFLVTGVFFSVQVTRYQVRAIDEIAQDIKETEVTRMNERLKTLEKLRYEQKNQE